MNCPNCNAKNMRTTETFKAPEETVRTKQCQVCKWKYTSRETISGEIGIPRVIRNLKSKRKVLSQSGQLLVPAYAPPRQVG
jgi:transcriptional regulator NrdR family protein